MERECKNCGRKLAVPEERNIIFCNLTCMWEYIDSTKEDYDGDD